MWTAATALAVAIILALTALIFVGLGLVAKQLTSVLLPLAVAGIIAYLLDPVVDFFQRRNIPRSWSIILVFFLAVLFQAGLLAAAIPRLAADANTLVERLPKYQKVLSDKVNRFLERPSFQSQGLNEVRNKIHQLLEFVTGFFPDGEAVPELAGPPDPSTITPDPLTNQSDPAALPDYLRIAEPVAVPGEQEGMILDGDTILNVSAWLGDNLGKIGIWFQNQLSRTLSWFGLLAGFALIPVYVFYFLTEKKGIQDNWTDYLPIRESRMKVELVFVLRSINDSLIVFFRSQVLVAMCVGILLMIGFSLIGLPYAVLLGFMAGLLSIVPYLGVMLSIIPALTIAVIDPKFGIVLQPILTLGVFVFVQTLEGLVISPKIIGDRVGLHPLTVIIAIMAGTTLMGGITGGVLAIPLTAALRTLMFRYVWRRRDWSGPPEPAEPEEPQVENDFPERIEEAKE